ncbi:hypothetical protein [Vibrio cholerae]|uniref:hypothetical protein n=1 Tax=Vibrio cholerae TaxID=666 RepID=UPI000E0D5C95|nr:hypothetical protein [Vibrio cholerae]EGR3962306.1 hypothetical protein [Vibrio cholerae]EKF9988243.1 hypothetical protein [Vibrio cholerae]ELJ8532231.1 hypothetical protein [Vibrio cholerae]MDQ4622077.1 hypothetical protein [Vibrio cholerae]MDQ4695137.1 hypothetical protein [Vibrio cholerae]
MLDDLKCIWSSCDSEWKISSESFVRFNASLGLHELTKADVDSLCSFIEKIKEDQDIVTIKVFHEKNESIEFSNNSNRELIVNRNEELKNVIEDFDGEEELSIVVDVFKKLKRYGNDTLISKIYSLENLSSYIESLSLKSFHDLISSLFYSNELKAVIFYGDFSERISTDYFHFIPNDEFYLSNFKPTFSITRAEEIKKLRANLGHFSNASEWQFLPDNFKFLNDPSSDLDVISSRFNGLHNAYLISCFANISTISDEAVEYRVKGLKDIAGSYDFDALVNINADFLWVLYKWIYEGNSVDKMGVTRNLVPLHVEDLLSVDEPVLSSAYSSFILSQKDDVKNYIDATNKLADQVQVTTQKAGEVAEKVANSIKTGVFGVATFAISTILFRIFSRGSDIKSYSDLFVFIGSPLFISMIIFSMAIFSSLFGLALYESFQDQNRFKEMYNQSKMTYENVLTKEDMKNILNDDDYFKKNCHFISERRAFYIWVWIVVTSIVSTILMLANCYALSIDG